jgi:phosphoribosyl-ATP pyrophosphohydrolase/phosphoribosyl-AMP cyclohydrolase
MKIIPAAELLASIQWNEQGLAPAIIQDATTKSILMLAYMNEESLRQSLAQGETVFWSRSRHELWHKGATSGNTQRIQSIRLDCDQDTLLIEVIPHGPACHTGERTCFFTSVDSEIQRQRGEQPADHRFEIIETLERTIAKRELERPVGAYTTYLFEKGIDKILKKVGEEAAEVIIAAKNRSPEELRYEASDLIFHLLVLLQEQKLPLDEVLQELTRRHRPQATE